MAWIAAVITTVDTVVTPFLSCFGYSPMAGRMISQVNLVRWIRHIAATFGRIVHLMVTISLRIFIDNELWHAYSLMLLSFHDYNTYQSSLIQIYSWLFRFLYNSRLGK
jgi:hypothetical protein